MISPDDPRLTAHADGALSPEDAARFEAELAQDPAARAELARLRALQAELRGAFAAEDAPPTRPSDERAREARAERGAPGLPGWMHRLAAAVCVVLMASALLLPTVGKVRSTAWRSVDASNLRQIGQAAMIYASDNRDMFPGAKAVDVWDYARLTAKYGGLNDAAVWAIPLDPAVKDSYSALTTVMKPDGISLEPSFRALRPSWAVVLGKVHANHPATTPIAWTRGLRPDGTWAPDSPYGTTGGAVVFLGGNVKLYRKVTLEDGFIRPDGTSTVNVLEALPPGTRVSEYVPNAEESVAWATADRSPATKKKELRIGFREALLTISLLITLSLTLRALKRRSWGALVIYLFISGLIVLLLKR